MGYSASRRLFLVFFFFVVVLYIVDCRYDELTHGYTGVCVWKKCTGMRSTTKRRLDDLLGGVYVLDEDRWGFRWEGLVQ